jgi:hypothetical protein
MLKRLSSRVGDPTPKSKTIEEIHLKSWKTIIKDDFSNQMIDRKSDFVNFQELYIPHFFKNKK